MDQGCVLKWVLWLMMGLLSVGVVASEEMQAVVGQPTTLSTACIRNNEMQESANASITVFDSSGNTVVPKTNMTPAGNGTFVLIYTFTAIGGYNTRETCDFGGGVTADGSTLVTVMNPTFGSMQVIAQGVNQVDLNKSVTAEWLLLLPNSTNVSVSTIQVTSGVCGVSNVNGSGTSASVTVVATDALLRATFRADPVDGFFEGENYEVLCNISLSQGLSVKGVKNFVYVTPRLSYLQFLSSLVNSIGQMLGIVQQIDRNVNETLRVANQTLQIVAALNVSSANQVYGYTPQLLVPGVQTLAGDSVLIKSKLTMGSSVVSDAVCMMSIQDQGTDVREGALPVFDAGDAAYVYNWTTSVKGYFSIFENCTGGSLGSAVVYGQALGVVDDKVSASDLHLVS